MASIPPPVDLFARQTGMDDLADLLAPLGSPESDAQLLALLAATAGQWEDAALDHAVHAALCAAAHRLGLATGTPAPDTVARLARYRTELATTGRRTPWLCVLLARTGWTLPSHCFTP